MEAKVIAVADVVEAISSYRPYRPALGIDAALQEIENGIGTKYDPDAVRACTALQGKPIRIRRMKKGGRARFGAFSALRSSFAADQSFRGSSTSKTAPASDG